MSRKTRLLAQKRDCPIVPFMNNPAAKHLTDIAPLTAEAINAILDRAASFADKIEDGRDCGTPLTGKRILSLFFEDSTRTRASFEMAARELGAQWFNFDIAHSSVKKGETLLDTVKTLAAIVRPDALIIRHRESGTPDFIAAHVSFPVINAGDGTNEHPTQALLDALTIRRGKGAIAGLTIAICGDIAHSRVARSNMLLLTRLGARVHVIAPPALMPETLPVPDIAQFTSMEDGLPGCDIVMMLRLQKERMEASAIPSESDYFKSYGLTMERLALAKPDALVMHPGPMNRSVEIADDVADHPTRSLILKQVTNGVPARMAVIDFLLKE